MRWMNHKKSRVMDFFRRIDKDQDGKVTRQEFIEGILSSSKCELRTRWAGTSRQDPHIKPPPPPSHRIPHQPSGDERSGGHIRPGRRRLHRLLRVCGGASSQQGRLQTADGRRQNRRRGEESPKWPPDPPCNRRSADVPVFPQVTRQVAKCKCPKRFQVEQIGANKYRVSAILCQFQGK